MEDKTNQTPPSNPAGAPGGNQTPPAVNQQPQGNGAATDDEKVTLLKKDFDALLKQRDTNGREKGTAENRAADAEERAAQNEALVNSLVVKDAVRDAIATVEFKEKYPDVSEQDLLEAHPRSDEEILKIAERMQQRYDKVKLDHAAKVQVAKPPTMSAADRDTQLKALSGPNKPKNAFQKGLQLIRTQVK